jgi:hypothetical protein
MRWCGVVGSATRPCGRVKTHEARGQVAHAAGKSRAAMCAPAAGMPVSFHRLAHGSGGAPHLVLSTTRHSACQLEPTQSGLNFGIGIVILYL